jgi:8-oxo-dGTP pyrophosphatase MutT (NUDIX family)
MAKHIIKYAGVIIKDKKFLVVREKGENVWKNVGGKLEENETPEECLQREIKEELGIELKDTPQFYFSLPTTQAVSDPTISLDIHLYRCLCDQEPTPCGEITELHWLSKEEFEKKEVDLAYQIQDFIVPRLIEDNII